ncbi:MAG: hypothetical protein AB1416_06815 [Actinomycetota bacterium]
MTSPGPSPLRRRMRAAAPAAALLAVAAPPLVSAAAAKTLVTYPVAIKVDMEVTQRSIWKGIKPGCFAPQESFDTTYEISLKTHPQGPKSKVKNAVATLLGDNYGTTYAFGAPGGAKQSGKSPGWNLEVAYPAGCGPDPAPPVPAGISAPKCANVSERVAATLIQTSDGKKGDGLLVIQRTPKAALSAKSASIGDSCHRTLHDVDFATIASELDINLRTTFIQIPVPKLHDKLLDLAIVSNPTRSHSFSFSGDCWETRMRPSIGPDPAFTRTPSHPHNAIGQNFTEDGANACLVTGSGRVTITRVGPLKKVTLPG